MRLSIATLAVVSGGMFLATQAPAATTFTQAQITAAQSGLEAMRDLNVITTGNWIVTGNGDVEGKAWIGGSISGGATPQVGKGNSAYKTGQSSYNLLTVNGDVTSSNGASIFNGTTLGGTTVGTYNGSATGAYTAVIGGSVSDTNNGINEQNAGGTVKVGGNLGKLTANNNTIANIGGSLGGQSTFGSNGTVKAASYNGSTNGLGGGTVTVTANNPNGSNTPNTGWTFGATGQVIDAPTTSSMVSAHDTMITNLQTLSTVLGSQTGASATRLDGGSGIYDLLFTVNSSLSSNIFTVSAANLFGARNVGFNLNGYTGSIVIDVTGIGSGIFDWTQGGTATWNQSLSSQLLWNFADALSTSVLYVDKVFEGSILDPYGTVVTRNSNIEGTVVAGTFNQSGEVHLGTFNDGGSSAILSSFATAPVPEPASWAMMILGFGVIGSALRRQRFGARTAA